MFQNRNAVAFFTLTAFLLSIADLVSYGGLRVGHFYIKYRTLIPLTVGANLSFFGCFSTFPLGGKIVYAILAGVMDIIFAEATAKLLRTFLAYFLAGLFIGGKVPGKLITALLKGAAPGTILNRYFNFERYVFVAAAPAMRYGFSLGYFIRTKILGKKPLEERKKPTRDNPAGGNP